MPLTITDHGTPVSTARQFTTALSPNAAGTDWNFIACSSSGAPGVAIEWPVIKNFTTAPSKTIYETVTHAYANLTFQYYNQLRAANGRIFFPSLDLYTVYYDPTTEQVHQIGPIIETAQPVDPNASTLLYSASFDVDGLLYMGTQESTNRPAMVCVTDTNTLVQTVLGYVGDGATGFTTYAYRLAPDTHGTTKHIYVVYGESSWQLWDINITTGVTTKLLEVGSSGNIQFQDITGKGWIAIVDTDLGQLDNVRTSYWCIDGAITAYTVGSNAPGTGNRNVTPQSNPLPGTPPQLDVSRGIQSFGWRAGGSGPYAYVNYTVNHTFPVAIESLVAASPSDGIVGNSAGYAGFFQCAAGSPNWFGAFTDNAVSEGPRLNVGGTVYMAGYPNGAFLEYNPSATWDPLVAGNPTLIGYFGLNGTQFAGIKYTDALAWAPSAGSSGRLYCAGERQRNGTGLGIGYWDKTLNAFAGTYGPANAQATAPLPTPASSPTMTAVLPSGIITNPLGRSPSVVVLAGISRVVFATRNISGAGDGVLFVFDYDLNYIGQHTPLSATANPASNLGDIFKSSTANVITGVVQGSGNSLGLYQYNVQSSTLVTYVELPIVGALGAACQRPDGSVWITSGTSLVRVDIDALTAAAVLDISSIAPLAVMAFATDTNTLFMAGGAPLGVSGARLYSVDMGSGPLLPTFGRTFGRTFDPTFDIDPPTRSFDPTFDPTFDIYSGPTYVALDVSPTPGQAFVGGTKQFTAIATIADGSTADVTSSVVWSSSSPSVASVGAATGLAAGARPGSALVTAELLGLSSTVGLTVLSSAGAANDLDKQQANLYGEDIHFDVSRADVKGNADYVVSAAGDWQDVASVEALRQSLLRRLITNPGEWATLPEFGVGARQYIKALNTAANRAELEARVRSQFMADDRVESIEQVTITEVVGDLPGLSIFVNVIPVGRLRQDATLPVQITIT